MKYKNNENYYLISNLVKVKKGEKQKKNGNPKIKKLINLH